VSGFVLDCSLALAWCFSDEATPATLAMQERLYADSAAVPALWPLEIANGLLTAMRRGRLSAAGREGFTRFFGQLPIEVDDETPRRALHDIAALAEAQRLTVYDAAYLELARRLALPLASLDRDLNRAAKALSVPTLIP
jgi:predicted nucleic acid-binding protein